MIFIICTFKNSVATEIVSNVFLSRSLFSKKKDNLTQLGITHVVIVDQKPLKFPGISYCALDFPNVPTESILEYINLCNSFTKKALEKGGKVLICRLVVPIFHASTKQNSHKYQKKKKL